MAGPRNSASLHSAILALPPQPASEQKFQLDLKLISQQNFTPASRPRSKSVANKCTVKHYFHVRCSAMTFFFPSSLYRKLLEYSVPQILYINYSALKTIRADTRHHICRLLGGIHLLLFVTGVKWRHFQSRQLE